MNHLRHPSALVNDLLEVVIWVVDKLVDRLLISEHAIFFVIFEDTKVGLTWHQKAFFNYVHKAKTKKIKRNMHKIRSTVRHQPDDLVPYHL